MNAGATGAGLTALQSAVVAARAVHEPELLARALVALGAALIHGVRGVDQEGLALLHEAVTLTAALDDGVLPAYVRGEIGCVDFLRGRYDRAGHWFEQARQVAGVSDGELGWVDLYDGSSRDDVGDASQTVTLLERSLRTAHSERDLRLVAFALTMLGRHHLV